MRTNNLFFRFACYLLVAMMTVMTVTSAVSAQDKQQLTTVRMKISIYTGWMPWYYMMESGLLNEWGAAYGYYFDIAPMDYEPSMTAMATGAADVCVMTNMDQLIFIAEAGVEATIYVMGDFSNGNDALLVRPPLYSVADLFNSDEELYMTEFSVTHYMAMRAAEMNGFTEADINYHHMLESDIRNLFESYPSNAKAVGTWNPHVMEMKQKPHVKEIFNSSQIPGEIIDNLVVTTEFAKKHPGAVKALVGAWFETLNKMSKRRSPEAVKVKEIMARNAGCSVAEYDKQLETTFMFWTPTDTREFMNSEDVAATMKKVEDFLVRNKVLSNDYGIELPNGVIIGDTKDVRVHIDDSFVKMAENGELKR